MFLPVPKTIPDVGPGGPLVTSMGAMNALTNANVLRQINEIKKKYMPAITQADINSKNAYAALVGLQPLGKILGNENAYGALNDDQRNAINDAFFKAGGKGQLPFPGRNNSMNTQPQTYSGVGQPSTNAISGSIWDKAKSALGIGQQQPSIRQPSAMPTQDNPPVEASEPPAMQNSQESNDAVDHELDAGFMDWLKSPEGKAQLAKNGPVTPPSEEELRARGRMKGAANAPTEMTLTQATGERPKTNAEKIAEFQGIKEEGKELGKIRGKSVEALDNQYEQALKAEVPLKHINEIVTNPIFRNLRKIPGFQKLQLDSKDVIGNTEEQKLIGDFRATTMNAVAQTVLGFPGRILQSEVKMANDMKIQPKDSFNSILGKLPSIETFNEMTKQRAALTSKIIQDKHINKARAMEMADKMVNGAAIRKQVEKELDYPVTIRNNKTGVTKTMPVSEARKLGAKHV